MPLTLILAIILVLIVLAYLIIGSRD